MKKIFVTVTDENGAELNQVEMLWHQDRFFANRLAIVPCEAETEGAVPVIHPAQTSLFIGE